MKTYTTVDDLRSLSTFRGSVTNGETWLFFSFNADDSGEGGSVAISKEFRLGDDLSGLLLILGLLSDWVRFASLPLENISLTSIQITNAKEREQRFFTYFDGQ